MRHRAAIQGDIAQVVGAHGVKSDRASAARGKLTEYDRACCRADMGQRMIDREQRRTGHAA